MNETKEPKIFGWVDTWRTEKGKGEWVHLAFANR